jgi:ATPase subunit of ABC transporter with duplicated ATPase domains
LLTGELVPTVGTVRRTDNFSYLYLDQQYSKVCCNATVLELAQEYNLENLQDHEVKIRLNRASFPVETWDKNCLALSGGERMRLYLCCLMLRDHIPDMLILDEPTNNLDLASLAILTDTVRNYRGTLVVISHDRNFVGQVGITTEIRVD